MDFLNSLSDIAQQSADIFGKLNQQDTAAQIAKANAAAAAANASNQNKLLPWIIGGAVAIVLAVLFFGRK